MSKIADYQEAFDKQAYPMPVGPSQVEWLRSYKYCTATSEIEDLSKELTQGKESLFSVIIAVRTWLNAWVFDEYKQPVKRPENILESRLISADEIYRNHLSSCGSMATLGATILRTAGIPVKLIDGSHPKSSDHAWVQVFFCRYQSVDSF